MNTLVNGFRNALVREGKAPGTLEKYVQLLDLFVAYVGDEQRVLDADRIVVETYLDTLAGRNLSVSTIRLHIAALRRFYDHLEDRELVGRNPLARIKPPKRRKKPILFLQDAEDEAVYLACVTPQERIVHGLLRYAGLRVSEACALKQRDVDLDRGEIHVRVSKSDAGLRTVVIEPRLRRELVAWFEKLERDGRRRGELPVLVTGRGTAMKTQFAWRLVKRVAHRAGVRLLPDPQLTEVSPHTLRRTFGTSLLNRGTRIEVVSKQLGHANTGITESAYAELLPETIRVELDRVYGA